MSPTRTPQGGVRTKSWTRMLWWDTPRDAPHPADLLIIRVVFADVPFHKLGEFTRLRCLGVFTGFGEHRNRLPIQLVGFTDKTFPLLVAGSGRSG